jgi:hypothetical protein
MLSAARWPRQDALGEEIADGVIEGHNVTTLEQQFMRHDFNSFCQSGQFSADVILPMGPVFSNVSRVSSAFLQSNREPQSCWHSVTFSVSPPRAPMCHEDVDRVSALESAHGRPIVRGLPTPANEVTASSSLISGAATVGASLDACSLTLI